MLPLVSGRWLSGGVQTLTGEAELEVVRGDASSINIADPNSGKNIRLEHFMVIFEPDLGLEKKLRKRGQIYRGHAERQGISKLKSCKQEPTSNGRKSKTYSPVSWLRPEESLKNTGKERG